ncbi:MAG: response regulator transcription factor [Treponema sp.]|jgi:DNA-binding NarL/FixJ family response regulator|nr:response regulator transcription factor [Treponema sp.]
MKKILIVEDQAMLRELLENLINEQTDMEVAGITDDAANALELCHKIKPDLVLMDVVTKNNSNGIRYTAEIRKEMPKIKIVIITALPEITFIDEAKKAGAQSFMDKEMGSENLLQVIRKTLEGYSIYSVRADRPSFAVQFTEKEIAVLRLVCQGKTRSEVANEMGISEVRLKPLITSILDKSGFDNIMKFAVYATGRGLILPAQDWNSPSQ